MSEKRSQTWTIYVCPKCGSPESASTYGGALICGACSVHQLKEEATTVEVIPLSILEGLVEELRERASHNTAEAPEDNLWRGGILEAVSLIESKIEATKEVPSE